MPIRHKILLGSIFTLSGLAALLGVASQFAPTDTNGPAPEESTSPVTTSDQGPATVTRSPRPQATGSPDVFDAATPGDERTTVPASWRVVEVIDGDTIDVTRDGRTETVRLVGIDSPEQGECGHEKATRHLRNLIGGKQVTLVDAGTDNRDRYDRLVRYVDFDDVDAGFEQIKAGMAIARYDSRDGYGAHSRGAEYISADATYGESYSCAEPTPEPEPEPSADPWNQPGPDLDCTDIGHRVRFTGPDYHRLDDYNDGWGCDSWG